MQAVGLEPTRAKMQAVGLEPTRANTLRPERSTLDHSVTLASVFVMSIDYFYIGYSVSFNHLSLCCVAMLESFLLYKIESVFNKIKVVYDSCAIFAVSSTEYELHVSSVKCK